MRLKTVYAVECDYEGPDGIVLVVVDRQYRWTKPIDSFDSFCDAFEYAVKQAEVYDWALIYQDCYHPQYSNTKFRKGCNQQ